MSQENKQVKCHIWNGESLAAEVRADITLPTGNVIYNAIIGTVNIHNGDTIGLIFGARQQVYTRSGKGFESEFPYGRVNLCGCNAGVTLNQENAINAKTIISTQAEFDEKTAVQKARVSPEIEMLKDIFILSELERRQKQVESRKVGEEKRQQILAEALGKVDEFFSIKPKSPKI